jgi:hypothetical protein
MTTYRLGKEETDQTKKTLIKIVPLLVLALIPALIMVFALSKDFPILLVIVPVMLVFVTVTGIVLGIKRRPSISVTLENDQLRYQRTGISDIVIRRDEVKRIVEHEEGGLTVESVDPTDRISVPKNLENYDQFKQELSSWGLIEADQTNKNLPYLVGGILVVLSVGAFVLKEKVFFYLLLLALGSFVLYQFAVDFKSMLVTKDKSKRIRLAISFLIVGYLIYRFIS